jgi:hypothetical protein
MPYHLVDFSFISFRQRKDHAFFKLYDDSFPPFKDAYFKVSYVGEEYPFWTGPDGSPLFPLYWSYEHYLRGAETYVTDQASLHDSELAIIAGFREFNKQHGLVKRKEVIRARCVSRADTLGNVAIVFWLFALLYRL